MRRWTWRAVGSLALVAAMAVLLACGNDDDAVSDTTTVVATTVVAGPTRAEVLVVSPNALGPYALGAPVDEVIAGVTAALGAPDEDTGWGPQQAPCEGLGDRNRYVRWGWVWAEFSGGPTEYAAAGVEHLRSFGVIDQGDGSPDPGVVDESGAVLLGATVAELKERYPEAEAFDGEIQGPAYTLNNGISGSLTEVADDGTVTSAYVGLVCID